MTELNEMTTAEILVKRDDLIEEIEKLQAEKLAEREQKAIAFVRAQIEEHADEPNKAVLLEFADEFARRLIKIYEGMH